VPNEIVAALRFFGALATFEQLIKHARNEEELLEVPKVVLDLCRKNMKQMALEAHPDRGGDEERMKEITANWGMVDKLQFNVSQPEPPPPPVVVMWQNSGFAGGGTSATGATNTYSYSMGADGWVRVDY
jgi:hypothetical protein